jgi:acetyl-CoA carboxylase biotin carboxyl carrier protein
MAWHPAHDGPDLVAVVRGVLDDLSGTSITRLELQHGDLRLSLRRAPGSVTSPLPARIGDQISGDAAPPEHWHAVEAPLTGLFYTHPAPDKEAYVHLGSHVEPDQVLGLIETMKMFNEVTADISGTIAAMAVGNGALVHAGDVLMYIEPGDHQGVPTFTSA